MDPQSRILLEQTSMALTDANHAEGPPLTANTGVYVGVMHMEYIQHLTGTPGSSCF
jgi:acyl transferase domain-containing protein